MIEGAAVRLSKQIGETSTRRVEVPICKHCGCVITEHDMCTYECPYDADVRPPEMVLIRVWERTDTLVEIRNP